MGHGAGNIMDTTDENGSSGSGSGKFQWELLSRAAREKAEALLKITAHCLYF
jgi:hypothetical protein